MTVKTQSIDTAPNPRQPMGAFHALPNDLVYHIFSYVLGSELTLSSFSTLSEEEQTKTIKADILHPTDDKMTGKIGRVCRTWNTDPVLAQERQKALLRVSERQRVCDLYPKNITETFKNSFYLPIDQLPELDLQGRTGGTGYIDFLDPRELCKPCMRFSDRLGRSGVAVLVRDKITGTSQVLALFQRYTGDRNRYYVVWNHPTHSPTNENPFGIEFSYRRRHEEIAHPDGDLMGCNECPRWDSLGDHSVQRLLKRDDQELEIPGLFIHSVNKILPAAPAPEPERRGLFTWITSLFSRAYQG